MINERNHAVEVSSDILAPVLFGHTEQIAFILSSIKTNKIPNAWLFHGPLGIGKASLALNVAKILSNIDFGKALMFHSPFLMLKRLSVFILPLAMSSSE